MFYTFFSNTYPDRNEQSEEVIERWSGGPHTYMAKQEAWACQEDILSLDGFLSFIFCLAKSICIKNVNGDYEEDDFLS